MVLGVWLERFRLIWVTALLPLFVFGEGRYLLYGLTGLGVLWTINGVLSRQWGRRSPADWSLLVWLLMIPVTLWATSVPVTTRQYLGYFLAELIAFYAVLTWVRTEQRLMLVAWGITGAGVGLAFSSLLLLQQGGRFFSALSFITKIASALPQTVQKNVMGGTLAVILPLAIGLILAQQKGKYYRLRMGGACSGTLAIAAGLVLTQSRGAWLAVIVALVIMAAIATRRTLWLGVGAGLLGLALVIMALSGNLGPLVNQFLQSEALGGLDGRLEVWSRALMAIQDFAFTGIGLGGFSLVIPAIYPYFLSGPEPVPHAHNLFLQIGVDLGLPGLISFLLLLFWLVRAGFTGWRNFSHRPAGWITLGCLGALCAMLTHGLVDSVTWGTKPAFLSWAILGLLLAAHLTSSSKKLS